MIELNTGELNSLEKKVETELLPLVKKPGRYVGNELNSIHKNWDPLQVTFALIFPELYELGMSYQGFDILYHILNRENDICAERVFAPDEDLEALLREKNIPLFSLETKMPLKAFDILGFTYQYELHVTNILNILDLGHIPLRTTERDEQTPLVFLGGPCAFNPEPLAEFIDVVVLGDGEEIVLEIAEVMRQARRIKWNREEKLLQLAKIGGIYIPQFYEVKYLTDNTVESIVPTRAQLPPVITARTIHQLDADNYPPEPIVPYLQITHDRASLEIMRGCTRGCRFCHAGMVYRPVRERSVDELIQQARNVTEATGYEEISLVSLSSSDYSQLRELITKLTELTSDKNISLSFPSLRPETFTSEIAQLAGELKKSGLTLAPEAGTERLRKTINKTNTNEDLLQAVRIAFENGWQLIKLYFMIGQPTETQDDLDGIVDLLKEVVVLAKRFGGKKINVSISPFVPKPHTPFQWEQQDSIEALEKKIRYLRERLHYRNLNFSWRDTTVAQVEGSIARGNRKVGPAIFNAWQAGAKFDAWTHKFCFETWVNAFKKAGLDLETYCQPFQTNAILPWQHLSKGLSTKFLLREQQQAYDGVETPDCRSSVCHACGLITHPACQSQQRGESKAPGKPAFGQNRQWGRGLKRTAGVQPENYHTLRVKYQKGPGMRFYSHLDLIRFFDRAFRRAGIPVRYSQGFHPHPLIAFGPPLALGHISEAEYLDLQYHPLPDLEMHRRLKENVVGPDLTILQTRRLFDKGKSLMAFINRMDYEVLLTKDVDFIRLQENIINFQHQNGFEISRTSSGKAQRFDAVPYLKSISLDQVASKLKLVIRLENGKTIRIDEILIQILNLPPNRVAHCLVKRKEMYIENGDSLLTPMDI